MIAIIDYKTGNLGSIRNMLKKIGNTSIITSDLSEISKATKLILPGVGAYDNGVQKLKEAGLWELLNRKVLEEKTPILGICLGAQLMTSGSEEGVEKGFGWVHGHTIKFKIDKSSKLKVPNMGWNKVFLTKESDLFHEMHDDPRFYFVHSYHFDFDRKEEILTNTEYSYPFVSSFERDNVLGVQFHPEKSHKFGMKLLKNFAERY